MKIILNQYYKFTKVYIVTGAGNYETNSRGCRAARFESRARSQASRLVARRAESERGKRRRRSRRAAPKATRQPFLVLPLVPCARATGALGSAVRLPPLRALRASASPPPTHQRSAGCIQHREFGERERRRKESSKRKRERERDATRPQPRRRHKRERETASVRELASSTVSSAHLFYAA